MTYIFYNPLSNNKKGKSDSEQAEKLIQDKEISYFDITAATAKDLLTGLKENDTAVICGGDGTLHHFVNALYDECGSADAIKANLFYYPTGSGNDFMHDVAGKKEKTYPAASLYNRFAVCYNQWQKKSFFKWRWSRT